MIPILQASDGVLLELLRQHGFDQIMVNVNIMKLKAISATGSGLGVAYSFEGRIIDGALVGEAIGSAGMRRIGLLAFFDDTCGAVRRCFD